MIIAAAPADARIRGLAAGVAVPVVAFATLRFTRLLVKPSLIGCRADQLRAPASSRALARAGLRQVAVVCAPGGRSLGGAVRRGARGLLILRPELRSAPPDLARFIALHEAAHLVRNDTLMRLLAGAGVIGVECAALLTNLAMLWLAPIALAGFAAYSWHCEITCDRMAARVGGRMPTKEFIAYLNRTDILRRRAAAGGQAGLSAHIRIVHPPHHMRVAALLKMFEAGLEEDDGERNDPGMRTQSRDTAGSRDGRQRALQMREECWKYDEG